jgi:hypothetical protein
MRSSHDQLDAPVVAAPRESSRDPDAGASLAQGWGYSRAAGFCELVQLREVDHDRIGVRTGDNPDGGTVGGGVDLLVNCVGGNEHEVSRAGLNDVLQAVAPPVSGGALQHVQDCLLIAVVVRTGRCAG